jgi:hypothetical protein
VGGGPGFTLTVYGANFPSNSAVLWSGQARATTFVSSTQLTAQIPASDIAQARTVLVTVANSAPHASIAAALPFVVTSNEPVATITGSSLALGADGSGNHTLMIEGSGMLPGSVVQWGSTALSTVYISPWELSALVPAQEFASQPASVAVVNPAGDSAAFAIP